MADYEFQTDDFDHHQSIEVVEARDDVEARNLAELRLLLSGDFSAIAVYREGQPRFRLQRDSLNRWAGAHLSRPSASPLHK